MSSLPLTSRERRSIGHASQIAIAHWHGSGVHPCGWLWTKDAGWDRALDICGCRYPEFVVRDGVVGAAILPETTTN